MSCLRNKVLIAITIVNGISFLLFGCMLDSDTCLPGIICVISFTWLVWFGCANGCIYKPEKGEEMEEQKMKVYTLLSEEKHKEYVDDIADLVKNLISGVCNISDKYEVDRDSSLEYVAGIIGDIAAVATIQDFGKDEKR